MRAPDRVAYLEAMQSTQTAFGHLADPPLRHGVVQRNGLGLPSSANGAFAITFDVRVSGRRYALRCFTSYGKDLAQRYAAISDFIRSARLHCLVEVDFLAGGINVGGTRWPALAMPWVDGICLNDWIDAHLGDRAVLGRIRAGVADSVATLRKAGAAHGDLQHGNILVQPDNRIRLIDYDGMYVPALAPLGASERGNRSYQHPLRDKQFDASLDSFAGYVIDLSIQATIEQPALWADFNVGDNLLFTATDLADPARSEVFARLAAIPTLAVRAQRLRTACLSPFEQAEGVLNGSITPSIKVSDAATAPPPAPARPVVSATERGALLQLTGEEVTVIGKVLSVKNLRSRTGGTYSLVNFGDYRRGAFTLVLWERTRADVERNLGNPDLLEGSHVSVTGRITIFIPKTEMLTPQIELRHARALRRVSAAEAAVMLKQATVASGHQTKSAPPPRPAKPVPPPVQAQAAQSGFFSRLEALYSSTGFQAKVKPTNSPTISPPSSSPPVSPPPPSSPHHTPPSPPPSTPRYSSPPSTPPRSAPPPRHPTRSPPRRPAPPPPRPAPTPYSPPSAAPPPSGTLPYSAPTPPWQQPPAPQRSPSSSSKLPAWWVTLLRGDKAGLDEWSAFGVAFSSGSFVAMLMACCSSGPLRGISVLAAMLTAVIALLHSVGVIVSARPGTGKPWHVTVSWISTAGATFSGAVSMLILLAALLG